MGRYNSVISSASISAGTTLLTPGQGVFSEITAGGVAVQLPNPALYNGNSIIFFNNSGSTCTLQTTVNGGNIQGAGLTTASTQNISTNSTSTLYSDGNNWIQIAAGGGAVAASTLTATSTVNLNPSGAVVTISPTASGGQVVISSPTAGTTGTIDNMNIGATTRGSGAFTTLSANNTVTLSPANTSVTISPSGSGTLVVAPAGTTNTIDNVIIGNTTRAAGYFTSLQSNAATAFTRNSQGTTATDSANTLLITGGLGVNGTIYTVGFVETSSITFKENINPIAGALDAILQLTGVTYDRKDTKKHEAGLIAEEVYKHAPDLVALDEKGKPYGIHYTKVSVYLIECIKTLQAEINELKGKKSKKGKN